MNRHLYHPHLRSKDDDWLSSRSSWLSFFYPFEDRIGWAGDIQLYCRPADYQHVLDSVPGAPFVNDGLQRKIHPNWPGLDDYREQVRKWLACFDEQGRQIRDWKPLSVPTTVEPTIAAGPQPVKRAPWFGQKLSLYMKRGKPD